MSEEEIKQHLKFVKSSINAETKFVDISIIEYFEGLLDLYKQEKEKNKNLILGKFREAADKNSYIKDNYISKDKIREKIEELKKVKGDFATYIAKSERIAVLEELLKESE